MDARCAKHQFEGADNFCRQCGHPFCVRCLLYPFGERKPPYCIPCALVVSGVRSGKKVPKASWRERRAQRRAAFETPMAPAAATVDTDAPPEAPPAQPIEMEPVLDATWSQPLADDDPWFTSGDQPPTPVGNDYNAQPLEPHIWSPSHSSGHTFG